MKKTFTLLLTLGATAIALGETYTISHVTTNSNGQSVSTTGVGNSRGWIESLGSAILAPSDVLPDTVLLNQITLNPASSGTSVPSTFKLAVYECTTVGSAGTFLGISSEAVTISGSTPLTFNFDALSLSTDENTNYRFAFVSATTTAGDLDGNTNDELTAASVQVRHALTGLTPPGGEGIVNANNVYSWANISWMPTVTYSVSSVPEPPPAEVVPEPATATLSLLALAGLAARRRRK